MLVIRIIKQMFAGIVGLYAAMIMIYVMARMGYCWLLCFQVKIDRASYTDYEKYLEVFSMRTNFLYITK